MLTRNTPARTPVWLQNEKGGHDVNFNHKFPLFRLITMVMALGYLMPAPAVANELQLAGSYSANPDKIAGSRLGFRFNRLDVTLPDWIFNPVVYLEGSVNQFQARDARASELTGVALSPVLQWHLPVRRAQVYLEAGIGVSVFDGDIIHGRDLSSHFQFEDRIGVNWNIDRRTGSRLGLYFFHYSNANIDMPNKGLDMYVLGWNLPLD